MAPPKYSLKNLAEIWIKPDCFIPIFLNWTTIKQSLRDGQTNAINVIKIHFFVKDHGLYFFSYTPRGNPVPIHTSVLGHSFRMSCFLMLTGSFLLG